MCPRSRTVTPTDGVVCLDLELEGVRGRRCGKVSA